MAKAVYPGSGSVMCDGLWGRCEAEAKWRPPLRCALCDSCYQQLTRVPNGRPAAAPPPGPFIQRRFWTWSPILALQIKREKDTLIAHGAPIPELAEIIGNHAYVKFIKLCDSACEDGKRYIDAHELGEVFGIDGDELRELAEQDQLTSGIVQKTNRPPIAEALPILKEIAAEYGKGIRLDQPKNPRGSVTARHREDIDRDDKR